jgi:hypothetical protein
MAGFFETMRQKDAEYERQQESDIENQTGDWDPDYWARQRKKSAAERMFWQSSPPHPLYGKSAEEKVFSLIRWLL